MIAALVVGAFVFVLLALKPFYVPSEANIPTLKPGDRVLVLKGSSASRNELIVFRSPATGRDTIMRVVAVAHDRINQQGDRLYVNDQLAAHSFVPASNEVPSIVVPSGTVYVLGDNRTNAYDSRGFGPVPVSDIVGHVVFCVWPLGRIGTL